MCVCLFDFGLFVCLIVFYFQYVCLLVSCVFNVKLLHSLTHARFLRDTCELSVYVVKDTILQVRVVHFEFE